MPIRNLNRILRRLGGMRDRFRDLSPAMEEIELRMAQRQRAHFDLVKQTPFEPNTLRRYSPGRGRFPRPGEFGDATGTMSDRLATAHKWNRRTGRIEFNPTRRGNTHPGGKPLSEVIEEQEAIQQRKGPTGSLVFRYGPGRRAEDALLITRYLIGDWGQ